MKFSESFPLGYFQIKCQHQLKKPGNGSRWEEPSFSNVVKVWTTGRMITDERIKGAEKHQNLVRKVNKKKDQPDGNPKPLGSQRVYLN